MNKSLLYFRIQLSYLKMSAFILRNWNNAPDLKISLDKYNVQHWAD